jgi:hypothetical protein
LQLVFLLPDTSFCLLFCFPDINEAYTPQEGWCPEIFT